MFHAQSSIVSFLPLQKRHIEILKLRFGDMALQGPDVMLSDMQFSARLNKQISTEGFIVRTQTESPNLYLLLVASHGHGSSLPLVLANNA